MTATGNTPLLNYSRDQHRWNRNVSYLLAILCITQVSLAPLALLNWSSRLYYGSSLDRPCAGLSAFLLALAFPLSLRVALSLAELREKLDARPAPTEVAPDSLVAPTPPPYPQSPILQTPAQSTHSPS